MGSAMTADSHDSPNSIFERRAGSLAAWALLAIAPLTGCAASALRVDPEAAIAQSIPAGAGIAFRNEGGPIDEDRAVAASTLSLKDAIRFALETHPALQASLALVRVAQAEADLASLLPNPVLDVVLRIAEGGGLRPEIGLSTELVTLLRRPRSVKAAENRLRAEAANALVTALEVLYQAQSRYSAVQSFEKSADILEVQIGIVERLRLVAQARFEVGEGQRADLEFFEIEKRTLEIDAAENANALRLERLALARLIGQPSDSAEWSVETWRPASDSLVEESSWIDTALSLQPEIQRARWELAARDQELALASSLPLAETAAGVAGERDDEWSAGPSLSVPLPWSGQFQAQRERALALQAESRHRLTQVQRETVEQVRAAFATLRSSRTNLARLTTELIPLLERRRSDVERTYLAREIDVTFLLRVDQALQASRARAVDLERQASSALYALQRAVGGPAAFNQTLAIGVGPENDG